MASSNHFPRMNYHFTCGISEIL